MSLGPHARWLRRIHPRDESLTSLEKTQKGPGLQLTMRIVGIDIHTISKDRV